MTNIIYASRCGAALDSNVSTGGGTDDTLALQAALDTAVDKGHLRLVLDGAALISAPLRIHSNTTIVCPDKGCGLFLKDGSNCCLLRNADWDLSAMRNEFIEIHGGTFNHNARGQIHDHGEGNAALVGNPLTSWVIGLEFYGVRHLALRDVTIRNQRTFALLMANWEHVSMENVFVDLQDHMPNENQDGLHFFGPGRRLTLRNIYGNSGDDFIALAPDEVDRKSTMEDVLIDGVTLMGADQGIRMLCRDAGRLDRVTVRNVTGTYGGLGFFINPWFDSTGGHYGSILIENVDLMPIEPAYDYRPPFLFSLGGEIERLILKNIRWRRPDGQSQMIVAGGKYNYDRPETPENPTHIGLLEIDGLYVDEGETGPSPEPYIHVRSRVDELVVKNAHVKPSAKKKGCLIAVDEQGHIDRLILRDVRADGLKTGVEASMGRVGEEYRRGVFINR